MSRSTQARFQAEARAESAVAAAKARADSLAATAAARAEELIAAAERSAQGLAGQMRSMLSAPMQLNWEAVAMEQISNAMPPQVDPDQLRKAVSVRAYYKAEQRAFWPGHEIDDWLEAEREIFSTLFFSSATEKTD